MEELPKQSIAMSIFTREEKTFIRSAFLFVGEFAHIQYTPEQMRQPEYIEEAIDMFHLRGQINLPQHALMKAVFGKLEDNSDHITDTLEQEREKERKTLKIEEEAQKLVKIEAKKQQELEEQKEPISDKGLEIRESFMPKIKAWLKRKNEIPADLHNWKIRIEQESFESVKKLYKLVFPYILELWWLRKHVSGDFHKDLHVDKNSQIYRIYTEFMNADPENEKFIDMVSNYITYLKNLLRSLHNHNQQVQQILADPIGNKEKEQLKGFNENIESIEKELSDDKKHQMINAYLFNEVKELFDENFKDPREKSDKEKKLDNEMLTILKELENRIRKCPDQTIYHQVLEAQVKLSIFRNEITMLRQEIESYGVSHVSYYGLYKKGLVPNYPTKKDGSGEYVLDNKAVSVKYLKDLFESLDMRIKIIEEKGDILLQFLAKRRARQIQESKIPIDEKEAFMRKYYNLD